MKQLIGYRERNTINTHNSRTKINGEIRYPEVRVIGTDGEQLGVMPVRSSAGTNTA